MLKLAPVLDSNSGVANDSLHAVYITWGNCQFLSCSQKVSRGMEKARLLGHSPRVSWALNSVLQANISPLRRIWLILYECKAQLNYGVCSSEAQSWWRVQMQVHKVRDSIYRPKCHDRKTRDFMAMFLGSRKFVANRQQSSRNTRALNYIRPCVCSAFTM